MKWFLTALVFVLGIFSGYQMLFSNPQGASVVAGTANINALSYSLEVTTSHQAIINWNEFSIQANECIKFIQPSTNSCVLNRVVTQNASEIMGTLQANGYVYLINPNGVVFGKDAIVDTAAFLASTLDIMDKDFLENKDLLFKGNTFNGVVNYGTLTARHGDVILLGHFVDNAGEMMASNGEIALAAAKEVLLKPTDEKRIFIKLSSKQDNDNPSYVNNKGHLEAIQAELNAEGNPYALAINHSGTIKVQGVVEKDGRIFLTTEAGNIGVSGDVIAKNANDHGGVVHVLGKDIHLYNEATIDVSGDIGGGKILIGGDYQGNNPNILNAKLTDIGENVLLNAGANHEGNGGTVIVWSDQDLFCFGSVLAKGGEKSGNGGFIEISGKGHYDYHPKEISTLAPFGKTGTLLLDPSDINITATASSPVFANPYLPELTATANLDVADLTGVSGLGSNNVTVTNLDSTGGGLGDINVNTPITWTGATTLTMNARNDIVVTNPITVAGGGLVLDANRDIQIRESITSTTGNMSFDAGQDLILTAGTIPATIVSAQGTLTVTATRDLTLTGGTATGAHAEISSVKGNITVTNIGRNLALTGGAGSNCYAQIGVGATATGNTSIMSNILFSAITGNVLLTGSSTGSGSYAQIGHAPTGPTSNITVIGDVTFPNTTSNLIGETVTLTGGNAANTTAIIGHGNEFTNNLRGVTCINGIRLMSDKAITLAAGPGSQSSAIIGFHNPATSATNFTVNCPLLEVQNRSLFTIDLTADNGSNAVIGYYNDTALTGDQLDITISSINVIAGVTLVGDLNLTAGNDAGTGLGVAAIGTYIKTGTVSSSITCNYKNLTLTGPILGENGKARIINNRTNITGTTDITLGTLDSTDISVLGGASITTGAIAEIYSNRDLIIRVNNFTVNSSTPPQRAPAQVVADRNIILNQDFPGNRLDVIAGDVATASALLQANNGFINIGAFGGGTQILNVTVGSTASEAASQILMNSGSSTWFYSE